MKIRTRLIVIELFSGLGNRLQAISSLARIAEMIGCELRVLWRETQDCGAGSWDLFARDAFETIDEKEFQERCDANETVLSIDRWAPETFLDDQIFEDCDMLHIATARQWHRLGEPRGRIEAELVPFLRRMRPCRYVAEKSAEFRRLHDLENAIGVHVRRGDAIHHVRRNSAVGVERYFEVIGEMEAGEPIYLATESRSIVEAFQTKYADRVFSYPCRGLGERDGGEGSDRSQPAVMQDAFIELLLLSGTKKVIAPQSSFSRIACILRFGDRRLAKQRGEMVLLK